MAKQIYLSIVTLKVENCEFNELILKSNTQDFRRIQAFIKLNFL